MPRNYKTREEIMKMMEEGYNLDVIHIVLLLDIREILLRGDLK